MKRFPWKDLHATLEEFRLKFSRINCGGCGVMASILAYHLKPLVEDMRIVSYSYDWEGIDSIDRARPNVRENTVRSWNAAGIHFAHIWVEFKWRGCWYTIDSEGIRSRREMYYRWGTPYKGSFTLNELRQLISRQSGWNDSFNRDQIHPMRRLASKRFQTIKANNS